MGATKKWTRINGYSLRLEIARLRMVMGSKGSKTARACDLGHGGDDARRVGVFDS